MVTVLPSIFVFLLFFFFVPTQQAAILCCLNVGSDWFPFCFRLFVASSDVIRNISAVLGSCSLVLANQLGGKICLNADLLFQSFLSLSSLSYYRDENGDPPLPSWVLLFSCDITLGNKITGLFSHVMWCDVTCSYFNSVIIKSNYYLMMGYELVCSVVGMVVGGGNYCAPGSCLTPYCVPEKVGADKKKGVNKKVLLP